MTRIIKITKRGFDTYTVQAQFNDIWINVSDGWVNIDHAIRFENEYNSDNSRIFGTAGEKTMKEHIDISSVEVVRE